MMKDEASTGLSGCSDADLIAGARAGGHAPLAELWRRHHRAGVLAARRCTSSLDPEDLVSEAFARIIRMLRAGGGPSDAFRPYLYATIRNIAARWASTDRSVTVDDWAGIEEPDPREDPAVRALERTLTARAFRSLPDRWQTVLWYTEVEGLDPHEAAPLLGLSPNAVAALAYRARDALRTAWLQAHIADPRTPPDCAWSVARLGEHARGHLPPTQSRRMVEHLAGCARCAILAEELDDLASHAALVLVPLLLGATAAGAGLASSGTPTAMLATASASPTPMLPALPVPMAAGASLAGAAVSHSAAVLLAPAVLAVVLALGVPSSTSDRPAAAEDGGKATTTADVSVSGADGRRTASGDAGAVDRPVDAEPAPDAVGALAEAGSAVDEVATGVSEVLGDAAGAVDGVEGVVAGLVDPLVGGTVGGTVDGTVGGTVDDTVSTIDGATGDALDTGAGLLDVIDELLPSIPSPTIDGALG